MPKLIFATALALNALLLGALPLCGQTLIDKEINTDDPELSFRLFFPGRLKDGPLHFTPNAKKQVQLTAVFADGGRDTLNLPILPGDYWVPIVHNSFTVEGKAVGHLYRNLVRSALTRSTPLLQVDQIIKDPTLVTRTPDKGFQGQLVVDMPVLIQNNLLAIMSISPNLLFDIVTGEHDEVNDSMLRINAVAFKKTFTFADNCFRSFYISGAHFFDSAYFEFLNNADYFTITLPANDTADYYKLKFKSCTFDRLPLFVPYSSLIQYYSIDENSNPLYNPLYSNKEWIKENRTITTLKNMSFTDCVFNSLLLLKADSLRNCLFKNCAFNAPLFLGHRVLDSFMLSNCIFSSLVDIRGTVFRRGSNLAGNDFAPGCSVLLTSDDAVDRLLLDYPLLERVFFIVDWGWKNPYQYVYWDNTTHQFKDTIYRPARRYQTIAADPLANFSEANLITTQSVLHRIDLYVQTNMKEDGIFGSEKQRIRNWLTYQSRQYEKLYYHKHNWLLYRYYQFLEFTVNFGYNGEGPFIRLCLVLIFLFALLLKICWANDILAFVCDKNGADFVPPHRRPLSSHVFKRHFQYLVRLFDITFFQCLYFSFVVFSNPRFPTAYFGFSKPLLHLVIFEWTLGLIFFLLFLYYIASGYPFVTKLLGL